MQACPSCAAALRRQARFCGSCGFELEGSGASRRSRGGTRRTAARRDSRRTVLGIALVFVGVLLVLLAMPDGAPDVEDQVSQQTPDLLLAGIFSCAVVLVGVVAAGTLGRGAWVDSFAGSASPREIGVGAAAGAAVLVVNVILLGLLASAIGESAWSGFAVPDAWPLVLITTAVLPALVEEWLCRGVLWTGLQRVTSERGVLVMSSVLFAMLHGLGGGGLLELPTRFLAGMAFGFLRWRSGSLRPAIAAHFVNNAIACFLA